MVIVPQTVSVFFFNFVLVAGNFLGVSVAKSSEILVSLRHTREVDTLINRPLIYLVQ